MILGEAAGVAAALAVNQKVAVADVPAGLDIHFIDTEGGAATLIVTTNLRAETVDVWKTTPPYPDVVDVSHATPEVAAFFKSYFTAKSEHKPVPTTDHSPMRT